MDEMSFDLHNGGLLQILVATIVLFLTGLFLWRAWVARRATDRSKLRLPPGPRGLPLVGSLLALGQVPHKSFVELSKKYGPLMFMHIGSKPVLVVCHSDALKEVFQTNDQVLASRPFLHLPSILFYDNEDVAFAPYGAHWRYTRKICNFQLLTASRLSHFTSVIEEEVMASIQLILEGSKSGNAVNITNLFSGLAMNTVTRMMWRKRHRNLSIGSSTHEETDKFHELFGNITALLGANVADFLPALASVIMQLSGLERKARAAHKEMDAFLEKILREREEQLSEKQLSTTTTDKDDFLDVLLKLSNESTGDSERLSRKAIKAILMDMVVGGSDTSSNVMEWALVELMRNPDMVRKAQDELNTVVGTSRLVTPADIPNLKYVGAIIKETLRRRCPIPLIAPHLAQADCKVGGYDVPANTIIFIVAYAIHHDESLWERPMEFNPDRFLGSDVDFRGRHFELLPFSSGRRMCPGINLSSSTLHLGLAQLLHCVNWSLPAGQTPESMDMSENSGLVLSRAKPLFLTGKPRLSPDVISAAFPL